MIRVVMKRMAEMTLTPEKRADVSHRHWWWRPQARWSAGTAVSV